MVQITKDNAYDAVAPDDFPGDAGCRALRRALHRVRQDHLRDPRPFLGSAGQEIHRLHRALRHGRTDISADPSSSPIFADRASATSSTKPARSSSPIVDARWSAVVDPAWRAGRARAVGLALPHPARSGRAGIRRQPDARRSAPRHGVLAPTSRRAGASRCRVGPTLGNLLNEIVGAPVV